MENKKAEENLKKLNLLFETLGFDEETKKDHMERIMSLVFVSVSKKLDQMIVEERDSELPEMESFKDFYDYYEQYVDQDIINSVIEETAGKKFKEYFTAIAKSLPEE